MSHFCATIRDHLGMHHWRARTLSRQGSTIRPRLLAEILLALGERRLASATAERPKGQPDRARGRRR